MTVGNLEKNIARNMLSTYHISKTRTKNVHRYAVRGKRLNRKGERETPSEAHCGDRNSKW